MKNKLFIFLTLGVLLGWAAFSSQENSTTVVSATSVEKEQENINFFYHKNNDCIQYYRLGKTILDEYYFVRNRREMGLNLESFYFERDPNFSTNYDLKVTI